MRTCNARVSMRVARLTRCMSTDACIYIRCSEKPRINFLIFRIWLLHKSDFGAIMTQK